MTEDTRSSGSHVYQHEGLIYVRPVGRGICIVENGEVGPQLEDLLDGDGYYRACIVIEEKVAPPPDQHPALKPMKPFDPYISGGAS
jgi:hypothetical protein